MKPVLTRFKLLYILFSIVMPVCWFSAAGWTTKHNIDLGEFIKEITIINVNDRQTQSAIWLPFEFNANAVGGKDKKTTDISILKSYLIFMVQCSIDRQDRHIFASQDEITGRAILESSTSAKLKPLASVPQELSAKLESIKAAMTGGNASAANMYFLVFDLNDSAGKSIIDSSTRDKLTLTLGSAGLFDRAEFVWHTPFDATTDAGACLKCGEKIKAKWHYCPWCGNKL
ncbi:MAG: zinc ribbon domain-containing protein [Phycisphaerae bacterium]|nr:zinc ribbon domain-containing protein [Phycisphaerae bacterium]